MVNAEKLTTGAINYPQTSLYGEDLNNWPIRSNFRDVDENYM
jgi:hypothetical protein